MLYNDTQLERASELLNESLTKPQETAEKSGK